MEIMQPSECFTEWRCFVRTGVLCPAGTTSEEGVIFVYGIFNKPVSAVESTVYVTAIFKHHALRVLHKYLPLYREADRRNMLAQVREASFTLAGIVASTIQWMFYRGPE